MAVRCRHNTPSYSALLAAKHPDLTQSAEDCQSSKIVNRRLSIIALSDSSTNSTVSSTSYCRPSSMRNVLRRWSTYHQLPPRRIIVIRPADQPSIVRPQPLLRWPTLEQISIIQQFVIRFRIARIHIVQLIANAKIAPCRAIETHLSTMAYCHTFASLTTNRHETWSVLLFKQLFLFIFFFFLLLFLFWMLS